MVVIGTIMFLLGTFNSFTVSASLQPTEIVITKKTPLNEEKATEHVANVGVPPFISNFLQHGTNIFFKPHFLLSPTYVSSPTPAVLKPGNCDTEPISSTVIQPDIEEPVKIVEISPGQAEKEIIIRPWSISNSPVVLPVVPSAVIEEEPLYNDHPLSVGTQTPLSFPSIPIVNSKDTDNKSLPDKIPAAPELPPLVIPELPVITYPEKPLSPPFLSNPSSDKIETPSKPTILEEVNPIVIPEAPQLSSFPVPDKPLTIIVEELVPTLVQSPEHNPILPVKIPAAPELPPFEMPKIPVIPTFYPDITLQTNFSPTKNLDGSKLPPLMSYPIAEEIVLSPSNPMVPLVDETKPIVIPQPPELSTISVADTKEDTNEENVTIPPAPELPPLERPKSPVSIEHPIFVSAPCSEIVTEIMHKTNPIKIPDIPILPSKVPVPVADKVDLTPFKPMQTVVKEADNEVETTNPAIKPDAPILPPLFFPEGSVNTIELHPEGISTPPVIIDNPAANPFHKHELMTPTIFKDPKNPTLLPFHHFPIMTLPNLLFSTESISASNKPLFQPLYLSTLPQISQIITPQIIKEKEEVLDKIVLPPIPPIESAIAYPATCVQNIIVQRVLPNIITEEKAQVYPTHPSYPVPSHYLPHLGVRMF